MLCWSAYIISLLWQCCAGWCPARGCGCELGAGELLPGGGGGLWAGRGHPPRPTPPHIHPRLPGHPTGAQLFQIYQDKLNVFIFFSRG